MFKKIVTVSLALLITVGSLNAAAFAAPLDSPEKLGDKEQVSVPDRKIKRDDINRLSRTTETTPSNKSTMVEYDRAKAKGQGFSTGRKVAIGVGIALGVLAIGVFAASRDKIRPFNR